LRRSVIAEIKKLDPKEKAVLREYFIQCQNTILLPVDHPVVSGLIEKGMLHTAGDLCEYSVAGVLFPVALQPHVKEMLKPSMFDLPSGQPTEADIKRLKNTRPEFISGIKDHIDLLHPHW
jgi:hypothetical protein